MLYDRTFSIVSEEGIGKWLEIDLNLKNRKMTFENNAGGSAGVGAGNLILGVSSSSAYTLGAYYTTGHYRDLQ